MLSCYELYGQLQRTLNLFIYLRRVKEEKIDTPETRNNMIVAIVLMKLSDLRLFNNANESLLNRELTYFLGRELCGSRNIAAHLVTVFQPLAASIRDNLHYRRQQRPRGDSRCPLSSARKETINSGKQPIRCGLSPFYCPPKRGETSVNMKEAQIY